MFRLVPRQEEFFGLFERQADQISESARRLREMAFDFSDAPAKAGAIKELEHTGDVLTHDVVKKLNTTFVTPFDREDVYALASRLDDVLDLIEAASDRLVLYSRSRRRGSGVWPVRPWSKGAPRAWCPRGSSRRRSSSCCPPSSGSPWASAS
jgi:uncharacterized protein Yka (UPF0111/DUF47 family)